jgi:hypothetical protein
MGNLEKAGVLVVVALLAVILVVAFLNFPEQKQPPMLGASIQKPGQAIKPPPGFPEGPEVIRPKPDVDRSSSDAAPRLISDPIGPVSSPPPAPPKKEDVVITPTPPPPAPPEPVVNEGAKKPAPPPASGYPKIVKVQAGESLWTIAVREYGPKVGPKMLNAIADANPKIRPDSLKTGTEISLPAPPGETASAPPSNPPAKPVSSSGAKSEKPAKETTAPAKTTRRLPFVPE